MRLYVVAGVTSVLALFSLPAASLGSTNFPVTTTADSGPGSLRQAILNANGSPGIDRITFNIPGAGVHTIAPLSPLPMITDEVIIDGASQPGYSAETPLIVLSGVSAGAGADGLYLTAGNSAVMGLVINAFQSVSTGGGGSGIVLDTGGSNQISACFIGTDATGTMAVGNSTAGISIVGSSDNQVGVTGFILPTGNLIAGNGIGVLILGECAGNRVQVNLIGTKLDGASALGNAGEGVAILAGDRNTIQGNTISGNGTNGVSIGGTATNTSIVDNRIGTDISGMTAVSNGLHGVLVSGATGTDLGPPGAFAPGNLISGNLMDGVHIADGAIGTFVLRNRIGTDISGNAPLGNGANGVALIGASGNQIGGYGIGDGNVISGNGGNGVQIQSGASSNLLVANFIGTNISGEAAVPNGGDGVQISAGSTRNVVGVYSGGNVISGNALNGVRIVDSTSTENTLERNAIGIDGQWMQPVPNGGNGVLIENGASSNLVGTFVGANRIAFNVAAGVSISSGNGNLVTSNAIVSNGTVGIAILSGTGNTLSFNGVYANGSLGIDLAPLGVTPNDAGDSDTGPNQLQNFPILASASAGGTNTHVLGSLMSAPSTTFRVEFFASSSCDSSGYGQGQFPILFGDVSTDVDGVGIIDALLTQPAMGPFITATATDPGGNTSEFSPCVMLPGPVLTTVSPTSGPAGGGTPVAISGMGFQSTVSVAVGGVAATSPVAVDTTHATAVTPALPPGALYDVVLTNADGLSATLPKGWLADFTDVPGSHPFHAFVEKLFRKSVTAGCGLGNYCVNDPVTRAQVAVLLLRSHDGPTYVPPPATGTVFGDVPVNGFAAAWIEELASRSVTAGCGGGNYCPTTPITRAQMSVFLLRMEHGAAYVPPDATGLFGDVPVTSPFARWVEQLVHEGVTAGCGGGNFCPNDPNTRGQMAVFLVTTFGL